MPKTTACHFPVLHTGAWFFNNAPACSLAPTTPGLAIGAFNATGKAGAIHQGACSHAGSQGGAIGGQQIGGLNQVHTALNKSLNAAGGLVGRAQCLKQSQPWPRNKCLPHQLHHRHAHPAGFASGGDAVERFLTPVSQRPLVRTCSPAH